MPAILKRQVLVVYVRDLADHQDLQKGVAFVNVVVNSVQGNANGRHRPTRRTRCLRPT
jgi:hypothetical protein